MRFLLNLDCHKKMKKYLITMCLAVGMVLPAAGSVYSYQDRGECQKSNIKQV